MQRNEQHCSHQDGRARIDAGIMQAMVSREAGGRTCPNIGVAGRRSMRVKVHNEPTGERVLATHGGHD